MKVSDISVELVGVFGNDLSVVNAARVSFHKEAEWERDVEDWPMEGVLKLQDEKLINYLAKHKHFSPFNHSFISVRVKAPIFVARQLVKHKFMPWNEVSRRYVDDEPEFYLPEWRERADNVKQGSKEGTYSIPSIDYYFTQDYLNISLKLYNDLLEANVAPEQARMILPQNMMTEWWWSGTVGAFCEMVVLRLDKHTQYESRIVAQKIRDLILPVFPVSLKARLETAGVE